MRQASTAADETRSRILKVAVFHRIARLSTGPTTRVAPTGSITDSRTMKTPHKHTCADKSYTAAVNTLIRLQDHVVAHRQLVELGFPERVIRQRTTTGGPWQRILPSTYLTQTGPPSRHQLMRSALLYCGSDRTWGALLTGTAALELYGVRRLPRQSRIHVLVPCDSLRTSTGHAVIERTPRMPGQVTRSAMACTPFIRALIDAARRSEDVDEVRAVLAEAVQRRFCTPAQILEEVANGPMRRSRLAHQVALEIGDGVRSPAEAWMRDALIRFRVPAPRWNAVLRDSATARIVAVPDALWVGSCLVAEVDSRDYHLSPEDWRRTQQRHAMLTALGFVVLHFAPTRIKEDPEAVCVQVTAALAANAGRPWPRGITVTRADGVANGT